MVTNLQEARKCKLSISLPLQGDDAKSGVYEPRGYLCKMKRERLFGGNTQPLFFLITSLLRGEMSKIYSSKHFTGVVCEKVLFSCVDGYILFCFWLGI